MMNLILDSKPILNFNKNQMTPFKLTLIFVLGYAIQTAYAQSDTIYIWPHEVPGESKPKAKPLLTLLPDGTNRVIEITDPFLAVFLPKAAQKNGKIMIICPGGGYVRLAVQKEGYAIADWLIGQGYTVFVLQYRVPYKRDGAVQDLTRALKYIRYHAADYGIDDRKIGAMGFSAGAHLVVRAAMSDTLPRYERQDLADRESGKPDCMVIIYPGYLSGGPGSSLSPGLTANEKTVDTFIFQTMDDGSALSALALAKALQQAKSNVELHMPPKGGHGYGMYPGNKAAETWPRLLADWLREHF